MKKFLITILLSLLVASTAEAYTIRPGDTLSRLAKNFGVELSDLAVSNGIQNPDRIFVGQQLSIPEAFGASNQLPTDGYDSYLSVPLNSSDTSIYVNDLPSGVTSSIYTIYSSDGRTVSEKVSCTGKTSSPNTLTGCTRGLSLTPTSAGTVTEAAGTGTDHSKNARIAITDNINFSGKALAILNGDQQTGTSTFGVGETSTNTIQLFLDSNGKYLRAYNNGTNPFVRYNTSTNKWQFSDDGTNTTNFATTSAAGLSASTTRAIGITDSLIYAITSSTGAIKIDGTAGLALDGSDPILWTTSSIFANVTTTLDLFVSTTFHVGATSTLATTTVNGLDIYNVLSTSTQNADNYHTHNAVTKLYIRTLDNFVTGTVETVLASTTVTGGLLKSNNSIRIKMLIDDYDDSGTHTNVFNLKYGSTTTTLSLSSTLSNNYTGWYEAYLTGNASSSVQDIFQMTQVATSTGSSVKFSSATGSMAENSNTALPLQVTFRSTDGGGHISVAQTIIEFIKDPASS